MTALTDHAAFLDAIRADPGDETARLAYADWLDERGEADGEVVRLLCEVQRLCDVCGGTRRTNRQSVCPHGYSATSRHAGHPDSFPCGCCVQCPDAPWTRLEAVTGGLDAVIERLSERDRRLLACDCAERVLPVFERQYPGDDRPRRAIETARRYAVGREANGKRREAWGDVVDTPRPTQNSRADYARRAAVWAAVAEPHEWGRANSSLCSEYAIRAAGDPDAERRWQLCRAVEYRLGFVGPREESP